MVAGCGNKVVKYLLFFFNFIIFMLGLILLAGAVWVRIDNKFQIKIDELLDKEGVVKIPWEQLYTILYICIGLGVFLTLAGFMGCCGACCESVCLLGLYFTLLLVLFVAEIALVVFVVVKQDTLKDDLGNLFKKFIVDKYGKDDKITTYLDEIQQGMKCCGARGCHDYRPQPPASCDCVLSDVGCSDKFYEYMKENIQIVIVITAIVLVVELLAMIFTCCLCFGIRNAYEYDYY